MVSEFRQIEMAVSKVGLFIFLYISRVACLTETCDNNYCTYIHGDPGTNVVIGAPHGGDLKPASIPDREDGSYVNGACVWSHDSSPRDPINCDAQLLKDGYTKEIALILADELTVLTGRRPHVIINELHRSKLDANREIGEAAQGVVEAVAAFNRFHGFIEQAKASVLSHGNRTGLYLDIHAHGHPEGWVELGYLVSKTRLNTDTPAAKFSSIRSLDITLPVSFNELLRGYSSLGFYLQELGILTVPSPAVPKPNSGNYFNGDYDLERHGSKDQGHFDAIQIETPTQYRTNASAYTAYTAKLAQAVSRFLNHYATPTSFCSNDYCQYLHGDPGTSIVINAARGGEMLPSSIPNRVAGCRVGSSCVWSYTCGTVDATNCATSTSRESYTKEIAANLADELKVLTGKRPHVIINDVHRQKMDGDLEVNEATFGHAEAATSYSEYHDFIARAKAAISGPGLFLDIHGHNRTQTWIELGYLVTKTQLNSAGALLASYASASSVKNLDVISPTSFEVLIRGSASLGKYLNSTNYVTVPSPNNLGPGSASYSAGGYCVSTYGSRNQGVVDAIQVNIHGNYRTVDTYEAFARDLAVAVNSFMTNYPA